MEKVWVIIRTKTIKRRKIQEASIDHIKTSLRWLLERLSYEYVLAVNFGNETFRDHETKSRPFARFAFDVQTAVVVMQRMFHDGQTQTATARLSRSRLIHTIKRSVKRGICSGAMPGPLSST